MRIGIIGAGKVGTTLGRAWSGAGHEVIYGAREPSAPAPHAGSQTMSMPSAAQAAELVVLTVPWNAVIDTVGALGDLGGKPLVDVTNPVGPGFALAVGHTTSGAEQIAARAKNARVVKAFNTTGLENMENPRYGERRVVMPVAGDDAEAVAAVAKLASDIGFDALALKGLVRARELEPLALLWIKLALQWGNGRNIGFAASRRAPGDSRPSARSAAKPEVITIVGSGNIGGALARAWLRSGHEVRIATRDASSQDVADLVAQGAKAVPVAEGANGASVIVFAIPAGAVVDVARSMGGLSGKIVVDCTNAIAKGFTLQYGHTTSSSEELARALPGAHVVRSFNQQGAETLQNPMFGGLAATSFVAADDEGARRTVRDLTEDVGLDAVEAGPLASSRYLEPMTLLWVAMSQSLATRDFGLSLLRR